MKKVLAKIAGLVTIFSMTFSPVMANNGNGNGGNPNNPGNDDNITICHVTGSQNNPFVVNTVDPNGWNGHDDHEGDFIITDLNGDQTINEADCALYDDEDECDEDATSGDEDCNEEPVCYPEVNLILNGGFESPSVTSGTWSIFPDETANLAWDVKWNGVFAGAPEVANLEIHNNLWTTAYEGNQYAELDADWGYNAADEKASVSISQEIETIPGKTYEVSYAFAPRPDTSDAENLLEVVVDGNVLATQGPVAGGALPLAWTADSFTFEATDDSTVIAFRDAGVPNTFGTLLDGVSVNCLGDGEPEVCTQGAPLYARVKINTEDATKWRNWNAGNLNALTPVFVGGNDSQPNESGGDVYDANEWFPLTETDGSFINDDDIAGYRDVPGIAVQRMGGAIRVVLFAGHEDGISKELAAGSIELSKDMSTRLIGAWDKENNFEDPSAINSLTRIHDATVNDPENPMDPRGSFKGYINQYNPRFDNVRVFADLFQFHLVADSASDGFYARYNYDDEIEVDCPEVAPQ